MKLLRVGEKGREKPAALDKNAEVLFRYGLSLIFLCAS